jgi:hypothetical protein
MGFLSASQQVEGIESSANRECQTPALTHSTPMPDAVPLRITARRWTHFNLAITYLTEVYCRGRDRVKPAQMENPRWQARVWGLGTHSNHNRGVSQMKSALEYSETQEESGDDVVTEGQSGRRTVISGSRPIPPYTPSPTGAVEESPESIVGDHQLSPISVG